MDFEKREFEAWLEKNKRKFVSMRTVLLHYQVFKDSVIKRLKNHNLRVVEIEHRVSVLNSEKLLLEESFERLAIEYAKTKFLVGDDKNG